jgi:hypothetical protein
MCSQTLRAGNLGTPRDALHRLKNKAVVSLKITVLWHAKPCGLAHRLRETYSFHLQGWRVPLSEQLWPRTSPAILLKRCDEDTVCCSGLAGFWTPPIGNYPKKAKSGLKYFCPGMGFRETLSHWTARHTVKGWTSLLNTTLSTKTRN